MGRGVIPERTADHTVTDEFAWWRADLVRECIHRGGAEYEHPLFRQRTCLWLGSALLTFMLLSALLPSYLFAQTTPQPSGRSDLEAASTNAPPPFDPKVLDASPGSGPMSSDPTLAQLIEASGQGNVARMKELLQSHGASVHLKDSYNKTLLMEACGRGHLELVEFLLENGSEVNAVNKGGETALCIAAKQGNLRVVTLLLSYGADPAIRDRKGSTAFHQACAGKDTSLELLRLLMEKGSKLDDLNYDGKTGLMAAAFAGRLETVEFLLANGADVNVRDNFGMTPLMNAARTDREDVVKLLLEKGARANEQDRRGTTVAMYAKKPAIQELLVSFGAEKPVITDPDNFELLHAQPYDKRLVNGLKESLYQYVRLFSGKPGILETLEVKVDQLNTKEYKVQYKVGTEGKAETYEVVLSNQSIDVRTNLQSLATVIKDFAAKRNDIHRKAGKSGANPAASKAKVAEQISHFDPIELFSSLRYIEEQVSTKAAGPQLLLSAQEIFSWLAFFKSNNENPKLSDLAGTYAVAAYLLGSLDGQTEKPGSFNEGLLLLALDYPSAALQVLDPSQPSDQLLTAYITFDFDLMKSLAPNPKINKRLLVYLQGCAFARSNQNNVADLQFSKLMTDYPDFLMAMEYVVDHAKLGLARQLMNVYMGDLLEKHLYIMKEFTRTERLNQDRALQQEIQKETSEANHLTKWLKIHGNLIDNPLQMKQNGKILTAEFLNQFLLEDISNALLIYYRQEDQRLGRKDQATAIVDMAKAAYPNKTISQVLSVKSDKGGTGAASKSISLRDADAVLLQNLIDHQSMPSRDKINLVKLFREKENPNAAGLYRIYRNYEKQLYEPVAREYLTNALAADPYDCQFYQDALKHDPAGKAFEKGDRNIGHLYGYLLTAAGWHRKNGQIDQAIACYRKAIEKSPEQHTAYFELGELCKADKKIEKAVETWQEYLKHDNATLSAVQIQNAIGNLWLETGEKEKAYEIFLKAQESGQAEALLGFAKASEMTGKVLEAENTYKKAAERYPQSRCASQLGIFYLRRKNLEAAAQVLREYRRFHQPGYYFPEVIDHCAESGNPADAVEIVRSIESANQENWSNQIVPRLARAFSLRKDYRIAADLLRPLTMGAQKNSQIIEEYCRCSIKGKIGLPDELVSQWLQLYGNDKTVLDMMSTMLLNDGLYSELTRVLDRLLSDTKGMNQENIQKYLMSMAIAWRMGKHSPDQKQHILQILETAPKDDWLKRRVLFLLDEANPQGLLELADNQVKRGEQYYLMGLVKMSEGHSEEALKLLLVGLENMNGGQYNGYRHAQALVAKLASPKSE